MNSLGKMIPYLVKMFFKKPDTIDYPFVQAQVADRFRGALKFDQSKCVGCKMCQKVCPSNALTIEKTGEKQFKATVCMDRCIFCGLCVDTCVKKALENTPEFELSNTNRDDMKVDI